MKIYKIIKPSLFSLTKEERVSSKILEGNNLYHTSYLNIKIIRRAMLFPTLLLLLSVLAFWKTHFISFAILLLAVAIHIIANYGSACFNYKYSLVNQYDIFIGYNFKDELPTENIEITSFIYETCAFLWPTWGIISILHPEIKNSSNAVFREKLSITGSHFPFILRPIDSNDWKIGVEWALKKCKFAVFDTRNYVSQGLQWEIDLATKHLGIDKIAFVTNGLAGNTIVVINGKEILTPSEVIKNLQFYNQEELKSIVLCCKLRKVISERVSVDKSGMDNRHSFDKFEEVKNQIFYFMAKLMFFLLVVGALLFLLEIINYFLKIQ